MKNATYSVHYKFVQTLKLNKKNKDFLKLIIVHRNLMPSEFVCIKKSKKFIWRVCTQNVIQMSRQQKYEERQNHLHFF